MRALFVLLIISSFCTATHAQTGGFDRPKLVVGITVDQMRQEYLYRYFNKFGEGGFKRLVNQGFTVHNGHYNYVPTYTGAGHASIYTGAPPAVHGIIGNNWYDKDSKRRVYCVQDGSVTTVGSTSPGEGKMSPNRMLTTTITDELKLFNQKRSKVIGISIKDRGAILPVGHMADGAYWYDGRTGHFITSTYYMQKLPDWVEKFNKLGLPDKYLNMTWQPFLPIDQYIESGPDDTPYEIKWRGKDRAVFPYDLKSLHKQNNGYDFLSLTPFSDNLLTEFAKAAIDGEGLGSDEWTDFLSISYSAPDKLGHDMSPRSVEVEDIYIRLDRSIEDLLKKLDQTVGKDNYIIFLTSDHGVAEVPQFLVDNKVPAGYLSANRLKAELNDMLQNYFPGKQFIDDIINEQVYLKHEAFTSDPKSGGIDLLIVTELIMNFLLQQKGIANVYSKNNIRQGNYNEGGYKGMIIRGYYTKRSGDIVFIPEPGWMDRGLVQGTTHGSPYNYDTHVPIIFYGHGIKHGSTVKYYAITDIAPTLSMLLKIQLPNGSTGHPIEELFE
jgi:predicted AlkP superfamily pyrophosphatase or phosphodiesterase